VTVARFLAQLWSPICRVWRAKEGAGPHYAEMPPSKKNAKAKAQAEAAAQEAAEVHDDDALSELSMDLSNVGRTSDGTGIAYRQLNCAGKNIGSVKLIELYTNLHFVDFSNNHIQDVAPLKQLHLLVKLDLSSNNISSIKDWYPAEGDTQPLLPSLTHLDLSHNRFDRLPPLSMKSLRVANFSHNEILSCPEFQGHDKLEILNLSANKLFENLTNVAGLPSLTKLDVSSNELQTIEGLSDAWSLTEISLADNQVDRLDGPWQELVNLTVLDLSRCSFPSAKPLEVLRQLPRLRHLGIAGNPFTEEAASVAAARAEVLVAHWRLSSIDGQTVTSEDLEGAKNLHIERVLEQRRLNVESEVAELQADE